MKIFPIKPLFIACAVVFLWIHTASALTISPARLEVAGDPGTVVSGEFLLINEQEDNKTFYTSAENFEAQGETGIPSFVASKDGLASWIQVASEVKLVKGQQVKVPFKVVIPKDADSGGHFAAIFLSTAPNNLEKGQVSVGAKIGMLVLLKVSGTITEGGGILEFNTKEKSSFFSALPVSFTYRFNNTGNDRANPMGDLIINNTFGFESIRLSANPNQGNVLPGSTRKFEVVWGATDATIVAKSGFFSSVGYQFTHFAFGRYTAHLNVTHGASTETASKVVYVFPWQLILVVVIVLILLLFIFIKALQKYNKWIIKKARAAR